MHKKILIISDDFPPYARGGAGMIAAIDAFELAKRGHDVRVIATVQEKSQEGTSIESGAIVRRIHAPRYHPRWRAYKTLYNRSLVLNVRDEIADFMPDIVHAHNVHEYISYGVFAVAKKGGARVYMTAHDVMSVHYGKIDRPRKLSAFEQAREFRFWYNPFRNMLIQRALKNVDQIFAVSEALKEALILNGIKNVSVLYNGIDPDAWTCSEEKVHAFIEKHALTGTDMILFGGRITGMKGGSVMVDALPKIVTKVPNVVLLLVGTESEYVRSLMARASEAGIADRIQCTGWLAREEISAAYHASRVVVVPSMYLDPLPTVVLEAMACEKPVVGMRNGGIPEMIEDGVTGSLVDPSDTQGFANALSELLRDNCTATSYGEAGRRLLIEKFSIDTHIKKLTAWYTTENDSHANL